MNLHRLETLGLALLALVGTTNRGLAQLASGGTVLLLDDPPVSVLPGALVDRNHIHVFQERAGISLPPGGIAVNIDMPGDYTDAPGVAGTLAAGTFVDVYLFHQDTGNSQVPLTGWVEFPEDVLGIIVTRDGLKDTDAVLGADPNGTAYPGQGQHTDRGLEFAADDVFLRTDRRRIDVVFKTGIALDEIRIITRAHGQEVFAPYCFGDSGCPCGNDVAAGVAEGCVNSTGIGGSLGATGSVDIPADDLRLTVSGVPAHHSVVLFMGSPRQTPLALGDGLLCVSPGPLGSPAGSGYMRFPVRRSGAAGISVHDRVVSYANTRYGAGSDIIVVGTTWAFQAIYRDPLFACTGAGFNQTSAIAVSF